AFAGARQTSIYDHFANIAGRGLLAQIAPLEERQEWESVAALVNAFDGDATPAMRKELAGHRYQALLAMADRIELGRARCTRFHDAVAEAERHDLDARAATAMARACDAEVSRLTLPPGTSARVV